MATAIEHLTAAHTIALRLQHAPINRIEDRIRSWPRLTSAVLSAQSALGLRDEWRVVERIALAAAGVQDAESRREWPGSGPTDQHVDRVTAALRAANSSARPSSADDINEAERLIASILWVAARSTSQAARDHAIDLRLDRSRSTGTLVDHVERAAVDVHQRVAASEHLAAGLLLGRPSHRQSDLHSAVASWDIAAQRALLTEQSTAVLHVLAHHEVMIGRAFEMAIDAARESGVVDGFTAQRLRPVLADTSERWMAVVDVAAEYSWGSTPVPRNLLTAAENIRDTFRAASLHPGTPEQRESAVLAFSTHLASSVSVAAAAHDIVRDGDLRAPARAVARQLREHGHTDATTVSPVDIHRGVSIPLPEAARELLADRTEAVYGGTNEALRRAASLDALARDSQAATRSEPDNKAQTRRRAASRTRTQAPAI